MIFSDSYMLNIYALILLLILFFSMIFKKETYRYSSRILRTVIILISVQLFIEILSWSFDTINEPYAKVLNYVFNLMFFVFGPIIVGHFFCYIDYLIYRSKERLKRRFYYMHLFVFFIILAIINIFTPIVFSISEANVYQREFWMNVAFISVFLKLIYMLNMTWKNRKSLDTNIYFSIMIFGVIPLIGGILQMFFYGLLIMWAFVGLSIVIAYIFTETINSSKDYLTKLFTREISEEYIIQLLDSNQDVMTILFDIDNLKKFNDQFGHKDGDQVLIAFSKALIDSFPKNTIISRYGGDEFLVALKDDSSNQYHHYLNLLADIISKKSIHEIPIEYSYGVSTSKNSTLITTKSLLHACDTAMYKQKASHKNRAL